MLDFLRGYDNTPHGCFATEPPLAAEGELPAKLTLLLRDRFKRIRIIKLWFSRTWGGVIRSEGDHVVVFGKSRHREGDWVLVVGPARSPTLLDRVLKRKFVSDVADVMLVCREIHALLETIAGVSAIRWYFEWGGSQTAAVNTPDELPWSRNIK